jgi:hypothetical protein
MIRARLEDLKRRPDGWPLCPSCGDDELYSLALPPTPETIRACYRCGPVALVAGASVRAVRDSART